MALPTVAEVVPVAVADVRRDAAAALAESLGCAVVDSVEELADPSRIDLVLIATPPNTHEELCGLFLRAGVPVMCEKPLSIDSASTRRIVALAESTGTLLTMASKFRFVPDVIETRSMINSGALGNVVRIENAFASRVDMRSRWNADPNVSGGGVIIDNGTHSIDIFRYLLGPVDAVFAASTPSTSGLDVEETATILVRTVGGQLGSVDLSWELDRMTDRYLAVFGTEGSVEIGWKGSRLRLASNPAETSFGPRYDKVVAIGGNVRNVARAVLGQEELIVWPADALASVAAVDACYESLRTGEWVTVQARKRERIPA
jgi:predicted dehydrogenase